MRFRQQMNGMFVFVSLILLFIFFYFLVRLLTPIFVTLGIVAAVILTYCAIPFLLNFYNKYVLREGKSKELEVLPLLSMLYSGNVFYFYLIVLFLVPMRYDFRVLYYIVPSMSFMIWFTVSLLKKIYEVSMEGKPVAGSNV